MALRTFDSPARLRLHHFRRLYQHMPHWREQIIDGTMTDVITIPDTGEEVFYGDLLAGIHTLPPRQREAFELVCLQGFTEIAAAKIMLPDSRWPTTVQQQVNTALGRMVAYYDEQQSGARGLIKKWRMLMSLHPIVENRLKEALGVAKSDLVAQAGEIKTALGQVDEMLKSGFVDKKQAENKEPAPAARGTD